MTPLDTKMKHFSLSVFTCAVTCLSSTLTHSDTKAWLQGTQSCTKHDFIYHLLQPLASQTTQTGYNSYCSQENGLPTVMAFTQLQNNTKPTMSDRSAARKIHCQLQRKEQKLAQTASPDQGERGVRTLKSTKRIKKGGKWKTEPCTETLLSLLTALHNVQLIF